MTDRGPAHHDEAAGKKLSLYMPVHIVKAFVISLVLTSVIGYLSFGTESQYYTASAITPILIVHFAVLFIPMAHVMRVHRDHADYFHPSLIAGLTFIFFYIVSNPLIYNDMLVLKLRALDTMDKGHFTRSVYNSYILISVAWLSYMAGHSSLKDNAVPRPFQNTYTPLYLVLGLFFIILGMIGNTGLLGSIGTYITKMRYFYERWEVFERAMVSGGRKWAILMRFLPVGLLILSFGFYLRSKGGKKLLFLSLLSASIANVFLSSATGGRGIMLTTFFYSIILLNSTYKKFSLKSLSVLSAFVIMLAFIMGIMRGKAYYGNAVGFDSFLNLDFLQTVSVGFSRFASLYLTNYLGMLLLVTEVDKTGVFFGGTAFSGLTGLLGGKTPLTTEAEMRFRLTGSYEGSNHRYGAPGELYFNFGWPGVIIGMFLIGLFVRFLSNVYMRSEGKKTLAGGLFAVFAAFTANFIIIGNLSYIPPYLTFYSIPFYLAFALFYNRKC